MLTPYTALQTPLYKTFTAHQLYLEISVSNFIQILVIALVTFPVSFPLRNV